MSDLVKRLRGHTEIRKSTASLMLDAADRIESLENAHEKVVKLVLAAGLSTGHADTAHDLMVEVLDQVEEIRKELKQAIVPPVNWNKQKQPLSVFVSTLLKVPYKD